MTGVDLYSRAYCKVQPINIANNCNNHFYEKDNKLNYSTKRKTDSSFKEILDRCLLENIIKEISA